MTCHNCAASCRKSGRNRNGTQRFRCPTCRKTFSEQRKTVGNMYLPMEKASQIAHLLVEGNSIRSARAHHRRPKENDSRPAPEPW